MSGLGRYIVDAVVLEHRSPTQLARDHDISKRWIFRALTLEPNRNYYGLGGRWPVHNVLQQVSSMS